MSHPFTTSAAHPDRPVAEYPSASALPDPRAEGFASLPFSTDPLDPDPLTVEDMARHRYFRALWKRDWREPDHLLRFARALDQASVPIVNPEALKAWLKSRRRDSGRAA